MAKTINVHDALMQIASQWTDMQSIAYEEAKRTEALLFEREELQNEVKQLKLENNKLRNQISVQRSYNQTLQRQLDEAGLRQKSSACRS